MTRFQPLEKNQIVGIAGVDTRAITNLIRNKGALKATIVNGDITDTEKYLGDCKNWPGLKGMELTKKVTTKQIYDWSDEGLWSKKNGYYKNNEYKNYRDNEVRSTNLSVHTHLTVWDSDKISQTNATRRIRTLQLERNNDSKDEFYVIEKKHLDLVKPKLERADYTDLDNVEPLPANRTIIASSDGKKTKKVRINVCHLKPSNLKSSRITDECEPKATKDDQFIYVPLDRYDWLNKGDLLTNLSLFQNTIKTLSKGLNDDDTEFEIPVIHGVKKHHLNKLDSNWITLDAYIKDLWQRWRHKYPMLAHESRMGLANRINSHDERWEAYPILRWCTTPAIKQCAEYQKLQDSTRIWKDRYEVMNAIILLGIEKPSDQFDTMLKDLNKK